MGKITTNEEFRIDFTLTEISAAKIVMWSCHVDDSAKGRYYTILDRYLLTQLLFNIRLSHYFIESYDGPYKGSTAIMVDLGTYEFTDSERGKNSPKLSL